jgi:hypothetical protein
MKFAYSVARYVPSLIRGEAINVGVALEAQGSGHLFVKFAGSMSRARLVFPDADVATISLLRKHFREAAESEGTDKPVFGYTQLETLTLPTLVGESHDTMLQFSAPSATIGDDPKQELDDLYDKFVAPRDATAAKMFNTVQVAPARLRARLFRRLGQAGLIGPRKLQEHIRVQGTVFPWEFDLGHSNGKVDLVQSIALIAPIDVAVNRALLLAARTDDVRAAKRSHLGHVIAAADRIEKGSLAVKLLSLHEIEIQEIGGSKLVDVVSAMVGVTPAK